MIPKLYLRNGHKPLAAVSVDNLSIGIENGVSIGFVPETLPYAAIMDSSESALQQFRAAFGLYVPSAVREPMATISLNPQLQRFPAIERAVFWHEYAHHCWDSLGVQEYRAWEDLLADIITTAAYELAHHYDIYIKQKQYYTKPEELWARIACQWLLHWTGDEAAYQDLLLRDTPHWDAGEFEMLQPQIWRLFRDIGFSLSSDSATKI